ncbi:uncharacterized protein FOMMEDRAFT_154706 [Fomitiporia mediterranea MF3/22]|uniref:uncharacterized protein n=1 Tax=Fomitiporia mediterranea (strain MF3/22) TaxID=694068 RepID=UPI0004409051|nr:uncharacterized protein FOMMEDRAFT_154706 [Fomitiporia mediterranea MF3/22]EJD03617.1 hypothetical protein FOMMEDRAFT_154706 [Fomitiporia mediterranea MF3/22]
MTRVTCAPPSRPQPPQLAITIQKCQRRYANRPVDHFPWKDFHLKMSGHGYVVGTDWAMTMFDTRTDDQFFDRKRLPTPSNQIDEDTEVLFFHLFDPLKYSSGSLDLNVAEGTRDQSLKPVQESVCRRVYVGTKSALS